LALVPFSTERSSPRQIGAKCWHRSGAWSWQSRDGMVTGIGEGTGEVWLAGALVTTSTGVLAGLVISISVVGIRLGRVVVVGLGVVVGL
jgi:hypothetical protein